MLGLLQLQWRFCVWLWSFTHLRLFVSLSLCVLLCSPHPVTLSSPPARWQLEIDKPHLHVRTPFYVNHSIPAFLFTKERLQFPLLVPVYPSCITFVLSFTFEIACFVQQSKHILMYEAGAGHLQFPTWLHRSIMGNSAGMRQPHGLSLNSDHHLHLVLSKRRRLISAMLQLQHETLNYHLELCRHYRGSRTTFHSAPRAVGMSAVTLWSPLSVSVTSRLVLDNMGSCRQGKYYAVSDHSPVHRMGCCSHLKPKEGFTNQHMKTCRQHEPAAPVNLHQTGSITQQSVVRGCLSLRLSSGLVSLKTHLFGLIIRLQRGLDWLRFCSLTWR